MHGPSYAPASASGPTDDTERRAGGPQPCRGPGRSVLRDVAPKRQMASSRRSQMASSRRPRYPDVRAN